MSRPILAGLRQRALAILVSALLLVAVAWTLRPRTSEESLVGATPPRSQPSFEPTVGNAASPPAPAPEGMAWIPGGEFSMGANDPPDMDEVGMKATADARPIHRVYVDGFYMERTDVTNAQFAAFVKATGYVTVAERTPRAEDF